MVHALGLLYQFLIFQEYASRACLPAVDLLELDVIRRYIAEVVKESKEFIWLSFVVKSLYNDCILTVLLLNNISHPQREVVELW